MGVQSRRDTPRADRVRADLISDFFGNTKVDRGGKRGLAFCDAYGINDDTVSFARLERRVAWVIGQPSADLSTPQLWIDKEFKVPLRLITVDKKSGVTTDTRLYGFSSAQTGEWYPRIVEKWENGALVERITFHRVKVNEPLDPALFKAPS